MIPIENFPATTTVDGVDGQSDCTVVGIIRAGDHFDFVVIIENDGERWPSTRDHVTAPDGAEHRPN